MDVSTKNDDDKKLEYAFDNMVVISNELANGINAIITDFINLVLNIDMIMPGKMKKFIVNPTDVSIKVLQKLVHKPTITTY